MTLTIYFDDVDVTEYVRLDSIRLSMQAFRGQVGAGTVDVDDTAIAAGLVPPAKEWRAEESGASPVVIAGGFIAERNFDRGPLTAGVQRQIHPVLEDWNTVFSDRVFKASASNRPEETDVQRVLWMLGTGTMSMLNGNGRGHVPDDEAVTMEKTDYRGKTPLDLLDECAEAASKNFYIYYKPTLPGWVLYYDKVAESAPLFTSDLKISDDPSDVDSSSVFAASRIDYRKDPERIKSGILVDYDGGFAFVGDKGTKAVYRTLEKTVVKENIHKRSTAEAWAEKQLERFDSETTSIALTVSVPPSALGELRAGQRIQIKMRHLGHSAYTYFRIIGVAIERRSGRRGVSDVEYDVRLTLKDKVRPLHKGKGTPTAVTADPGPYPLITGFTDVPQPTIATSNFVGSISVAGIIREDRSHYGDTPSSITGPTWYSGASSRPASSLSGYSPWTSRPDYTSCPGLLDNSFQGFYQIEQWYKVTMPEPPANAAGISMVAHAGASGGIQGPGYGEIAPLDVVVLSAQPSSLRQGVKVGEVFRNSSNTLLIPSNAYPGAGSNLYIGYRTSWECTNRADPYAYACGWTWPFMSNSYNLDNDGTSYCGRSGRVAVSAPSGLTWQTWGASSSNLGVAAVAPDASWAGSNTIFDAGSTGAFGAWGMSSNTLYVNADTPSGKGIYMVGSEEDEDQPDGPWSGGAWGHEFTFDISAHGVTTDAGTRAIVSTTQSGGVYAIGTVHLGDATRAEGISVAGPTGEVYVAKALTLDDQWRAKFDTRTGLYIRGKLWKVEDGEPAQWDVQAPLVASDGTLDRWSLWIYAGNDGTTQQARVSSTTAFAHASNGQRVVKEWIGFANGSNKTFKTAHQYRQGTLRAYVNGIMSPGLSEDGDDADFTLDFWPTNRSMMRATYVAQ